jgi:hypothetical protein
MSRLAQTIKIRELLVFFIPLGLSASLVTLSHVIIQSTLARAENPETVLASYAVAMSLFAITEKSAVLLRQTCSALVRDQPSCRAMLHTSLYVGATILLITFTIAFSPAGQWIFKHIFGVDAQMLSPIIDIYKVLILVTIFSGIRCFYHGVIIYSKKTKWLTIGMVVRLIGMYVISLYFIQSGSITAQTGALIFLTGMTIEASISFFEGRKVIKHLPAKKEDHTINQKKHIFRFYLPLALSTSFVIIVGPMINIFLGKSVDIELAIASYALAISIFHLVVSFFSYIHQIVINFYSLHSVEVKRFFFMLLFIPAVILVIFCFTAVGTWFLYDIIGANERLTEATLNALRLFLLAALLFPILDFCNGLLMLRRQTSVMFYSQAANAVVTFIMLAILITTVPHWNGTIGAFAFSVGMLTEVCVILFVIKRTSMPVNIIVKGV